MNLALETLITGVRVRSYDPRRRRLGCPGVGAPDDEELADAIVHLALDAKFTMDVRVKLWDALPSRRRRVHARAPESFLPALTASTGPIVSCLANTKLIAKLYLHGTNKFGDEFVLK